MIKKDTLVSVVTPAGEFVGEFEEQTENFVTLRNPKMIIHAPDKQMGFARGVCLTGKENPEEVTFSAGGVIFFKNFAGACNPLPIVFTAFFIPFATLSVKTLFFIPFIALPTPLLTPFTAFLKNEPISSKNPII